MALQKILIIEDDSTLLEALAENFVEEGYKVFPCANVGEAFRTLKEISPDIIITDLVMPNTDGFEALRMLKANTHLNGIPVIVLSNRADDEDIQRVMLLGAKDFLVKAEHSLREIVEKVKEVLA